MKTVANASETMMYMDYPQLRVFEVDHPATQAHKLDVLARHCETEGRDLASIQKTVLGPNPLDNVEVFLSLMEEYAKLGVTLVEVMPPGPDPVAWVTELGEKVVPRLKEI